MNIKIKTAKVFCSLYNLTFSVSDATHDSIEHGVSQFIPEMHEILVALQAEYPHLHLYDADVYFIPPSEEGEPIALIVHEAYEGCLYALGFREPYQMAFSKSIEPLITQGLFKR